MTHWLDPSRTQRRSIALQSGSIERYDSVVEVDLAEHIKRPRLFEVDAQGQVVDQAVNLQVDGETLIFMLKGITAPEHTRHFQLYYDSESDAEGMPSAPALVSLTEGLQHEGFESYRITTQNATYYYHLAGAGFASMIDTDGNDWISFHPFGGSDGNYRGIPNVAHPDDCFHPGRDTCVSEIVAAGPLKVTIASRSKDDQWACRWEIYAHHARLTLLKVAHPYWFLYEGTPGGVLDEAGDFMVRSDGERIAASERWDGPLPAPEWIYFGAATTNRVLYLVHHEADDAVDSYWPMEHNMTVFGFGRKGIEKFMTQTPAHFTIGFAENGDFESALRVIESAYQPLDVELGDKESR